MFYEEIILSSPLWFVRLSADHFIIAHLDKCSFGFYWQWVSLRELLSRCTWPLSVNELWALCYTCLSTLQTYTDFPGQYNTGGKNVQCLLQLKTYSGNVDHATSHSHLLSVRIVILSSRHGGFIAYARNTWHEAATVWMGH